MSKQSDHEKYEILFLVLRCIVFALLTGFILTLLSAFYPITLYTYNDLDRMAFGKPFAFLIQSYSKPVNDAWFPGMVTPKFSDGYSTEIAFGMFLASWGINTVIGGIAVTFICLLKKNRKRKK